MYCISLYPHVMDILIFAVYDVLYTHTFKLVYTLDECISQLESTVTTIIDSNMKWYKAGLRWKKSGCEQDLGTYMHHVNEQIY